MIENKDFQELLQKYPDDAIVSIGVEYNGLTAFWEFDIKGLKLSVDDEKMKFILLSCKELSKEYETLLNGGAID